MDFNPEDFPEQADHAAPGVSVHGAPFGAVVCADSWALAGEWLDDMAARDINGSGARYIGRRADSWSEKGPEDSIRADTVANMGMRVRTVPDEVRKAVQEAMPDLSAAIVRRVKVWQERSPGRFVGARWASGDPRVFRSRRRQTVNVRSVALVMQSAALGGVETRTMSARGLVLGVVADILRDCGFTVSVYSAAFSDGAVMADSTRGFGETSTLSLVRTVAPGESFSDSDVMAAASAAAFRAGHLALRGGIAGGHCSGCTRDDMGRVDAVRQAVEHIAGIDAALIVGTVAKEYQRMGDVLRCTVNDVLAAMDAAGITEDHQ